MAGPGRAATAGSVGGGSWLGKPRWNRGTERLRSVTPSRSAMLGRGAAAAAGRSYGERVGPADRGRTIREPAWARRRGRSGRLAPREDRLGQPGRRAARRRVRGPGALPRRWDDAARPAPPAAADAAPALDSHDGRWRRRRPDP